MPQMRPADSVDFSGREKLSFVAIVLPLLGVVGGLMRITGWSQEATLATVLPLLFMAFFVWRYATSHLEARVTASVVDREMWTERTERLERRRQELVASQQVELRQLRLRQQAEQDRLIAERASREELSLMMERHREEYEKLLERQTG